MTREELISIGRHKVRSNENLMLFYLQEFEKLFGRKPNCASCTFVSDWVKFERGINKEKNTFKMKAEKTFKLTNKGLSKIHTYKVGKQPVRSYGHNMTEEFALDYLSKGSEEQIAERKKWFNVLPEVKKVAPKVAFINIDDVEKEVYITLDGEQINLEDTTHKILTAYAKQEGIDFGDAKKVADKRDVIRKVI